MKANTIKLCMGILRLFPGIIVNEVLHRYAPDCWAPSWGKSQCLGVIEDILLSR